MDAIISLAIFIILCIAFCIFCGYATKKINESKGYTGGFWLGLLLQPIGILIVSQRAEQPNAKENAFKAVLLQNVFKKCRYPFSPPQFEPIAMLKGEINTEAQAAGLNLTFLLIHGVFMLGWYSVILGAYIWYIMGYTIYWLFKTQALKKYAKSDATVNAALAKEKARAAFSGLKDKASAFAAEHQKSSDETVYQSNEEYSDETADSNDSSAPVNTSPIYNTGTYSYSENKKSPIIYILIGVIAILLVVLGVLFGMLLMKNKNENNSSGTDVMYGDSTADTSKIEEMITTAIESTEETIPATTAPVESTTQTTISDQYTSDEVSAMFSAYIAENPDPNRTYDNSDYGYALIDLNSDDKQELLISSGENDEGLPMLQAAYTINNNKLNQLWISDLRTYGQLCENNYIYASYIYGSGYGINFYKYSSGNKLDLIESIDYDGSDYATSGYKITYNDNSSITEDEADTIIEKYKPIKFELNPLKIKNTEITKPETSTLNNTELGRMYNEFYIYSLRGYVSGGYIEDYNDDGVDDLIFWSALAGYSVVYYKNGTLESTIIPNTSNYGYDEPLLGMKTQYYAWDILPDKCREKAVNCGFTINKDFNMGSTSLIGYVKTNEIDGILNLRSAPSTDSDVLIQLPNGKLFNVIPESTGNYGVYDNKGWYYISVNQNGNNYMGYISADYAVAWDNAI